MSLHFHDGRSLAVAQTGPHFVVLCEPPPFGIPSGEQAVLDITIAGVKSGGPARLKQPMKLGDEEVPLGG